MIIPGLKINQSTFPLKDGSDGVIAVFMYSGESDPRGILDRDKKINRILGDE